MLSSFVIGLGTLLGLIGLIVGLAVKKQKLGLISFFATLLGICAVGFILGAPVLIFTLWLMLKPKKDVLLDAEVNEELKDIELDESDFEDNKRV